MNEPIKTQSNNNQMLNSEAAYINYQQMSPNPGYSNNIMQNNQNPSANGSYFENVAFVTPSPMKES
jgi:hypothetical protein